MLLYHGSNVAVTEPHLLKKQRNLDFGKGFYVTSDYQQALNWAVLKVRRLGRGAACVTCYEADEGQLSTLKTLRFERADRQWLDYVTAYRKGLALPDDYELVIGPVANDQTTQTLTLYLDGFLSAEAAVERLLTQRLKDQYTFRTEAGIAMLCCSEVRTI